MRGEKDLLEDIPPVWADRFHELGRIAESRGQALCLVGGCVRDLLLGRAPLDWDVMAEGRADGLVQAAAAKLSAGKVVRHPAFLTFTLEFPDGTSLDVATARTETYRRPAALPDVRPAPLAEDFARRDFSANAMAAHITPDRWGRLEDPLGGLADLKKGLVRVLHPRSFQDDPTRLYRAARYAGRYGWAVEPGTLSLARAAVSEGFPDLLSAARRRNELRHLLDEKSPGPALKMAWEWGLWKSWSPRWSWTPEVARALEEQGVPDPFLARVIALCRSGDPSAALEDLKALAFPRSVSRAVAAALAGGGAPPRG